MVGKFNFAADLISIGIRMYADLSKIATGNVKVLFLANIPEQFNFLVISGKFQMGFKDADGKPVEFDLGDSITHTNSYADLALPVGGSSPSLTAINTQKYIDVEFAPSTGAKLKADSITDDDPEFTLSGDGVGTVVVNGAPTLVPNQPNVYRYTFTGDFVAGKVSVNFTAGSFTDDANKPNIAETETFQLTMPSAVLAGPEDDKSISVTDLNANKFITVRFSTPDGTTLDASTIDGNEITLSGPGVSGLTVGSPTAVSGTTNTYQYTVSGGDFRPGEVTVNFAAGSFKDSGGSTNTASSQSFIVYGTTAVLANPIGDTQIDVAALNSRGYLDVTFVPAKSATIDAASITDAGLEFTLGGSAKNNVVINDAPTLVSGNTYRYSFTGKFVPGTINVDYAVGSWADSVGNTSVGGSQVFTAAGPTMALTGGLDKPTVGTSFINGTHYIDVRYKPTSGSQIDLATINGDEFTLAGSAITSTVAISGTPQLIDASTNTYRYALNGKFVDGVLVVNFAQGKFADTAGYTNLAISTTLTLVSPSAELYAPAYKDQVDYDALNQRGYILVTYKDPTGSGIDVRPSTAMTFTFRVMGLIPIGLPEHRRADQSQGSAAERTRQIRTHRVLDSG